MKKRILSLLLCLAMLLTLVPTAMADNVAAACTAAAETAASASPFVDVSDSDDYYYDPVIWAAEKGITNGTDDTHFSPEETCTRGQVVTFLYRAAGEPPVSGTNPFTDVKTGDYYYDAVLWGYQNGIVYGTSDTTFSPENTVTRAQFITFLYRYAQEPKVTDRTNPFKDLASGEYYADAVLWGYQNGIVYGTDTDKFSPDDFCTRAQVVTFLYRYYSSVYQGKIHEEIQNVFDDEGFSWLSDDEKADTIINTLKELASSGATDESGNTIDADTIEYDEESQTVWYLASDGSLCGVNFEQCKAIAEKFDEAMLSEAVSEKTESISAYNATTASTQKPSVLILYGMQSTDDEAFHSSYSDVIDYEEEFIAAGYSCTALSYVTVSDYMTMLDDYDIVWLYTHGSIYNYDKNGIFKGPSICTKEPVTRTANLNYLYDILRYNIAKVHTADGEYSYWINPSFFKAHYGSDALSDEYICIASCMSAGKSGSASSEGDRNYSLMNVFMNCGAACVTGFYNTVNASYGFSMGESIIKHLAQGYNIVECVELAKSSYGETEEDFIYAVINDDSENDDSLWFENIDDGIATIELVYKDSNWKLQGTGEAAMPGILTGRIIDADTNGALYGATAKIIGPDGNICALVSTSEEEGTFSAELTEAGTYSVIASCSGYRQKTVGNIKVVMGNSTDAGDISLTELGTVTGKIIDEGNNIIQDADITFYQGTTLVYPDYCYISDDGVLEAGLLPGTYTMKINLEGYGEFTQQVTVTGGEATDLGTLTLRFKLGGGQSLDDMPIIESDRYTGNQGDSFVDLIGQNENTRGSTDIDGVVYEHGIEGWLARWNGRAEISWAYAVFNLNGAYETLTGNLVLIKSYNTTNFDTELIFSGDGVEIGRYELTPDNIPMEISVNVSGVKSLKIEFHDKNAVKGGTAFGIVNDMLSTSGSGTISKEDAVVGNYVTFGNYEQDNDLTNGQEPIEWCVLQVDGDKALLISKYALDSQYYNTTFSSVTWETCSLRSWLNSTFYNAAFTSEEQAQIQMTTVIAEDNPTYGTDAGNDTQDQVFLLSIGEAEQYFTSDIDRRCAPTVYAVAQGVFQYRSDVTAEGEASCCWWLRSPGLSRGAAARVNSDGSVYCGLSVFNEEGVRPALWINLQS